MVCKEEVFLWFKSLKGAQRIEVLCGLLNMCCPLELRFCGSCLEDLGRRDFYTLRDEETKANNITDISKIKNINDLHTRSKLIITLSLLNSTNVTVANSLYKILTQEVKLESMANSGLLSDAKVVDEILLLLTMVENHPAFTFEQQNVMGEIRKTIHDLVQQPTLSVSQKEDCSIDILPIDMSPIVIPESISRDNQAFCHHYDLQSAVRSTESVQNPGAQITSLKAKAPHKKMHFRIRVVWNSDKIIDVFKTPHEITAFHQNLVSLFPVEAEAVNREKHIPCIPSVIAACGKNELISENLVSSFTEYIWRLNYLPSHIMQSEHVINFFLPSGHIRNIYAKGIGNEDSFSSEEASKNSRLRSITVYNSHISDNPSGNVEKKQKHQNPLLQSVKKSLDEGQHSSPLLNSPPQSPFSSAPASPTNSASNSRAASPWAVADRCIAAISLNDASTVEKLLIKEQLQEYWEILRHYRLEELQSMPQEELECLGMVKEAASKLRRILDSVRSIASPNGISNHILPRSSVAVSQGFLKSGLLMQPTSSESSPVCSEYSSPPPSPPPTLNEVSNHNSPNGSSCEEITPDKGTPSKAKISLSKLADYSDQTSQEVLCRKADDVINGGKNSRDVISRHSTSALSLPVGYTTAFPQMPPSQAHKPSFLPVHNRANAGLHLSPGTVIFDSQFSRVPLPSALSFFSHITPTQRSHIGAAERTLTSSGLPITTVCPFPVVTSGCNTSPSTTCSIATNKSCTVTAVTNSVAVGNVMGNRQLQKGVLQSAREGETSPAASLLQQKIENPYGSSSSYIQACSDSSRSNPISSCACPCGANVGRPAPSPSPSLSPGAPQQQAAVPVSMPYIGLPYVFHHSLPYIQAHTGTPANGFMAPPNLPTAGHGFTFAVPNGMSAIPPELLYSTQAFALSSASQVTPAMVPSVSQCYISYPHAAAGNMTIAHTAKVVSCYNCGKLGHRGSDCKDQNIDDMNKSGKYQLYYAISPNPLETND